MSTADFKLDAQLRDVALPGGLLDRLMALPLTDDEDLDELLREVAVPAGLLPRLQAIPLADDAGFDEALRDVPVPRDLIASCRRHARRHLARREGRRPMDRVRISRLAMAASLILSLTLSLGIAMLLSIVVDRSGDRQVADTHPVAAPPAPVEKPLETSLRMLADDSAGIDNSAGIEKASIGAGRTPQPGDDEREIKFVQIEPSGVPTFGELALSPIMPPGADPWAQRGGISGSEPIVEGDAPDQPTHVSNPLPHGLDWPLAPGSNRPFLQRFNFLPFVSPAADPRLQTCPVPLAVEPLSYELARRYLERNEWPPAGRIRTEEFLAAVDYDFPKPKNQSLGLIVAGGPSPISGEDFCLLQIGVQARQSDPAPHAPLHLVLLIDASAGMRGDSRTEIVRRALGDLPGIVAGEDRLSLVTFNQSAHVLVENLGGDALRPFAAAVNSLSAAGAANFVAGLREAYSAARPTRGPGRPGVRVVLLTGGLSDLKPAAAMEMERLAAQAAAENIPLDVIDLGQQKEADPQVTALAQAGRAAVHRAISARQIRGAFREIVTGRSQLAARAARLQVTFNPKSVLEYRLVGHESGDWAGLLPGPLEADFREGQAATALFELRLAPNGPNDLAAVELSWFAPDGGKTQAGKTVQKAHMTVERKHFAATPASSASSLQEAALVAYTAEVLRHSPFIFQRRPGLGTPAALSRAVDFAGLVDSRLRLLPSCEEFTALIRQEMKAHPARRRAKE